MLEIKLLILICCISHKGISSNSHFENVEENNGLNPINFIIISLTISVPIQFKEMLKLFKLRKSSPSNFESSFYILYHFSQIF